MCDPDEGIGILDEEDRYAKAAGSYQSAAETQVSAIAYWNLGWMYENGLGLMQDLHLARRYYDLCAQTGKEAAWPVVLSLIKLYIRSWWAQLMGGKRHLAMFTPSNERVQRDLGSAAHVDAETLRQQQEEEMELLDRARMELESSSSGHEPAEYDDHLDTSVRGSSWSSHEGLGGIGAGASVNDDGDGSEWMETMLVAILVTCCATLVWWRGRLVRQREEERQRHQEVEHDLAMRAAAGAGPVPVPAALGGEIERPVQPADEQQQNGGDVGLRARTPFEPTPPMP